MKENIPAQKSYQAAANTNVVNDILTNALENVTTNSSEVVTQRKLINLANNSKVNFGQSYDLSVIQLEKEVNEKNDKNELLVKLKVRIKKVADEILAQINQNADDCPYLSKWFIYYKEKEIGHIKQALTRFAPEAANVSNEEEFIENIVNKVKNSLQNHVNTGSIEDVPEELIEKKHQPQDFLHVALKTEDATAQLSCLKSGNNNNNNNQGNDVVEELNLQQLYEEAYDSGNRVEGYLVAKIQNLGNYGQCIIKRCPQNEAQWYETFNGTAHFPRYIGFENGYCALGFIGNFPEPAPWIEGGHSDLNILTQIADICASLANQSVSHGDLDNNLIIHNGNVFVIDLNPMAQRGGFNEAINANAIMAKRLIADTSHNTFDGLIADRSQ